MRFTADGRFLFLRPDAGEFPARVFRLDVSTGRREVWKELMPGDPAGITSLSASAISEDGKTVLFSCSRSLSDLYLADEVFMCGTAAEVTPLRSIDDHELSVGPITRELQEVYLGAVHGRDERWDAWLDRIPM